MSAAGIQQCLIRRIGCATLRPALQFRELVDKRSQRGRGSGAGDLHQGFAGAASFQLGSNFRAWMYRILHNTFLTSRTGLKQTITVPLELEKDSRELPIERETPEAMPGRGSDLCGPEARNFRIHFFGAGLSGRPRRALQ